MLLHLTFAPQATPGRSSLPRRNHPGGHHRGLPSRQTRHSIFLGLQFNFKWFPHLHLSLTSHLGSSSYICNRPVDTSTLMSHRYLQPNMFRRQLHSPPSHARLPQFFPSGTESPLTLLIRLGTGVILGSSLPSTLSPTVPPQVLGLFIFMTIQKPALLQHPHCYRHVQSLASLALRAWLAGPSFGRGHPVHLPPTLLDPAAPVIC